MAISELITLGDGQSFRRRGMVTRRKLQIVGFSSESFIRFKGEADLPSWWSAYLHGVRAQSSEPQERILRTMDLFAGVGGLALGFRQASDETGFKTESIVAVDQDKGALSVYQKNHQTALPLSDSVSMMVNHQLMGSGDNASFFGKPTVIPKFRHLIGSIDVILAGPPCQGHSNLNNHSRRDDERNELYLTVPAMAVALDVPMVIIENVPGVVHDHRSVVSTTISLLVRAGYRVTHGVLAADDMGWPQTRKRFFLIASKTHTPIPIDSVSKALSVDQPLSVSWAIDQVSSLCDGSFLDFRSELSAENLRRVKYLFENGIHDLPIKERPDCHKGGTTYKSVYGRMYGDKPAPTITGGFLSPGRGRFTHPHEPRPLLPREAAAIQGFPSTYDFCPIEVSEPAKTDLAKWIGNAVPMPLGFAASLSLLLPLRLPPSRTGGLQN